MEQIAFKKQVIEAILFSSSRFVSIEEIAEAVSLSEDDVKKIIVELNEEYSRKHSFEIVEIDGKYKIQLRREFYDIAKDFMEKPLTESEIKLVSVLAISKKLEAIKAFRLLGKEYSETLESLTKKGIIKIVYEKGRKYILPGERFMEFVDFSEESLDTSKKILEE